MISIILGGGAGTRLFPLTLHRAKPAVPLGGKYRLIDIPVSNCINSDVTRIFVLTQYNSASLNRHIARTYRFDPFRNGFVNVLAAEQTPSSQEWFQGTADAVRQSMIHVSNYRYDHVLILSGDQLYTMDYRKMLRHHEESGADISIATIPVTAREAPEFGILKTRSDGAIAEFHEKPADLTGKESPVSSAMAQQGRTYLASMGIYIFTAGVLKNILARFPEAHDFGKQIIPAAIDTYHVTSYSFEGYWSDIGTIRSFFDANIMLTRPEPEFNMYDPRMPLYTNTRMLPPARIQQATVQNSIVAEACILGRVQITDSVVGLRSYIADGAVLDQTIMMGSDYYPWHEPAFRPTMEGPDQPGIGEDTVIQRAIIDHNVSIGRGCSIRNLHGHESFDGDGFYIRDGIVVIPKNARIPDGTQI